MIAFAIGVLLYLALLTAVAHFAEKYTALVGVGGLLALLAAASLLP